jgi:MFS family permease
LRQLLRLPGFRKLFSVRLVTQTADGLFQVALATLLFFSPTNLGTAAQIASGFAVMLAPFTVVGPFAGVLLDRLHRRQVLLYGNVVRAIVVAAMAFTLWASATNVLVDILGLLALSINRFLLAALSAGMGKVISDGLMNEPPPSRGVIHTKETDLENLLLTANSVIPTIGAGAAFLGGGLGFVLTHLRFGLVPQNAAVLLVAALIMSIASIAAARLAKTELGPEKPPDTRLSDDLLGVVSDLNHGVRYLVSKVTPAAALTVTAIHRLLYGLVFIAAILLSRNTLARPRYPQDGTLPVGIAEFAIIMGLIGAGGAVAVLLAPFVARRTGQRLWIASMLLTAAISLALLATTSISPVVFVAAFILGVGAQGLKIGVDTVVQRDTDDAFRGRAFALYDVIFNALFVAAALLAAFVVPDSGWSRGLFLGMAGVYVLTAIGVIKIKYIGDRQFWS